MAKAIQFVKQHKKGVGIATVGAALIGVGAWGYNKWKNHEPKVVTEFHAAFRVYINAIRKGKMDVQKITKLMNALDALKQHKNYEKLRIQLTTEELEILVGRIYEYAHLAVNVVHLVAMLGDQIILIGGDPAVNGLAKEFIKQFHLFHLCNRK